MVAGGGHLMELLGEVAAWFADPAQWQGSGGIPTRLVEHLRLSAFSMVAGSAIAIPIGLFIGHTGRGALLAVGIANLGRAVPSYALLLVFFPIFGFGEATAFPALVLLAIPPILVNTYIGLRGVDRDIVEAGRGMGMTEPQLLATVELPAAAPAIVAGLRVASVAVIATATLAALVAGGGLGRFIADGFGLRQQEQLVAGALLVAVLALVVERAFTFVERRLLVAGDRRVPSTADLAPGMPGPAAPGAAG
jgi:osmoprotectant transport system permease protein